jgi:hypothetical protein
MLCKEIQQQSRVANVFGEKTTTAAASAKRGRLITFDNWPAQSIEPALI